MSRPADLEQEAEWVAGLQAGKLDTFRAMFEAYAPGLRRFARVWTPWDAAEDIVQDVMFDIWQRRNAIHIPSGSLSAYLFSAVRNRAITYLRRQATVRHTEETKAFVDPPGMGMGPPSPDAHVLAGDLRVAIDAAIAQLPDIQRAVLMLRWSEGLSYARISAILSISENAAMLHASRARKALHPALSSFFTESD